MVTANRSTKAQEHVVLVVYYSVLLLFLIASFFPQYRVWGFNWWAYYPIWVPFVLFAVGAVVPLLLRFVPRRETSEEKPGRYFLFATGLTMLYGLAFYFLRARTHFLGDGYQLLSRLADKERSVKLWDFGASLINEGVFSLMTNDLETRALLTFQIVSIVSGICLLVAISFLSRRLFDHNFQRGLFLVGVASSGYMLQFFGYVENYALLISAMLTYTLVGLLIIKGRASWWWALLPLLLAIFLHLFGVLLIPSLLYLLMRNSRLGRRLRDLSGRNRLVLIVSLLLILTGTYLYLYSNYYFFKFAFLPFFPDRFTVEDDMLFSLKHLADIGNLLLLLVPGLPVFVATILVYRTKAMVQNPENRFLTVLVLSTLGAVFVFNPGIGMPRNWDLFSVAGVPLAVMCYYNFLDSSRKTKQLVITSALSITLGFLSLAPRAVTLTKPELGVAHFKNYLVLDKIRNRNARRLLVNYYTNMGDTVSAKAVEAQILQDFPEITYNERARQLIDEGKYSEAFAYAQKAADLNPLHYDAYFNMGGCYLMFGNFDSALAYLEIANGINPNNAANKALLGGAYLYRHEYDKAEKNFLGALRIDSTEENALMGLVTVCLSRNELDRSFVYVSKLYTLTDQSYEYFRQAGDTYLQRRAFPLAAEAYELALKRGLDSAYVKKLAETYPQLKHELE